MCEIDIKLFPSFGFDYCALRGIQVQAHHQASFHLHYINNFFMVVKYAIDYWSTACFLTYLSSHHSCEEIKYTHSHFSDWKMKHRKEKQLAEGSCPWKRKDLKNQTHPSLQGFILSIVLKSEILL